MCLACSLLPWPLAMARSVWVVILFGLHDANVHAWLQGLGIEHKQHTVHTQFNCMNRLDKIISLLAI